ncbi:MAG: hypothetical protein KGJ31_00685 [Patescibacteria group bacterium]|nr:hypothetical protein [Patescibacteria group bacterium]
MNKQSNIERTVMRRVKSIRVLQPLLSGNTLAAFVFVAALWGIGREVWVARVFANAPHDLKALPQFYLAAFDHTRLVVQALTLLTLASLITLARETARTVSSVLVRQRV